MSTKSLCYPARARYVLSSLLLSFLLSSCGAGPTGEGVEDRLASFTQNAPTTASVDGSDAAVVRSSAELAISTSVETQEVSPSLGAANAIVPEQQALSVDTVNLPTTVEQVSNPVQAAVEQVNVEQSGSTVEESQSTDAAVPVTDEVVGAGETPQTNETFSENEQEEVADSVSFVGCVGNLAWHDVNGDGRKTSNEAGIAIELIELVSSAGNVVDSTATTSGYYQLCAVPGSYTIRFSIPENYTVTVRDAGTSDTADSDADEAGLIVTTVEANKNRTKYDIGLVPVSGTNDSQNQEVTEAAAPGSDTDSSETASPVQSPLLVVDPNLNNNVVPNGTNVDDVRWGFWTETRNAYDTPLGNSDEGVETTFENYTFAHVKALALSRLGGNTQSKEYVVNVLAAATQSNTVLDLQLGSAGEYGWNFSTQRGNFNLNRWKESIANFSEEADPVAHAAITQALQNGTIRYIFLIDEPNHKRWSPSWDGTHGASAPGDPNYVSNQDLDEMAASVKATFGNDTKTIVRTSAVNLITGSRRGMYVFEHMTHAYLTISSTKWTAGSNKGPNKGFEWFLNLKNNHTDNTTNMSAYLATGLKPSLMVQAGFESSGNPWTGSKNFKSQWWQGDIRYPYNGATGYVKTAPGEMDFWIKSLLSPRDPVTGQLSDTGVRWFNEFVIFRADRLPTDAGRLPFSTYPHYNAFLDQLDTDLSNNNLNPIIGIPVDWTGN